MEDVNETIHHYFENPLFESPFNTLSTQNPVITSSVLSKSLITEPEALELTYQKNKPWKVLGYPRLWRKEEIRIKG
ncbi:hypothetical protein SESBI_00849 [Sesbania bispinosa]|nr:hypothetical protein SESBI_00849 [Sesbania bispinosa]